ncbi:hypothetical protein T484DRAFT_1984771 [Baffinella frigidus]|nr:hypothetical protein T484DRAFT_1984771 [Cryptophyta sp. CCMP2293]
MVSLLVAAAVVRPSASELLQQREILHTQVNMMGFGDGLNQGGYAVPLAGARPTGGGAAEEESAAPAPAPDMSVYVRRGEEDSRFNQVESRMKVDENSIRTMQETIRQLTERLDNRGRS